MKFFRALVSLLVISVASAGMAQVPNERDGLAPIGMESNSTHVQDCATLIAQVLGSNEKPVDAKVEMRSLADGTTQSLNVGVAGDAVCVKPGWYRITAQSGVASASQELQLDVGMQNITLRLNTTPAQGKGTVSAASLQVPGKARKALQKARELIARLHYDDALRFIGKAMEIYPQSSEAYQLRGLVWLLHHEQGSAISDFQRSIALDPGNAMPRIMIGSVLNDAGKFRQALVVLQAALPLAPDSWQAQYELGRAYAGTGKLPDALHALTRGLELKPDFPPLRLARGMVLLRCRQFVDATTDLRAFLLANPHGPDAQTTQQLLATATAGAHVK